MELVIIVVPSFFVSHHHHQQQQQQKKKKKKKTGGSFTREELANARKEGDLEPGWKERAEKRKLLGVGGEEERGFTEREKEQRGQLFAGGSGKEERLKEMKDKEARRKREEEEKEKEKQR